MLNHHPICTPTILYSLHVTLARSRAWLSCIRAELLPRRLAVELRACADEAALANGIATMGARRRKVTSAKSEPLALDASASPTIRGLALLSCAGLTDQHLLEVARRFPRLRSFALHACARCTDAGVAAVLERCGAQLVSFSLGHLVRCTQ